MPDTKPYAGIICYGDSLGVPACGKVDISSEEYTRQMMKPDALWTCPNCGSTAQFDDARYEHLQGIDTEAPND